MASICSWLTPAFLTRNILQTLVGRPKLFFIEACRGKDHNYSQAVMTKSSIAPQPLPAISLPRLAQAQTYHLPTVYFPASKMCLLGLPRCLALCPSPLPWALRTCRLNIGHQVCSRDITIVTSRPWLRCFLPATMTWTLLTFISWSRGSCLEQSLVCQEPGKEQRKGQVCSPS